MGLGVQLTLTRRDPLAAFATLVLIASLMALAFVLATRKDD
jgi:hypothetical protein